MAAALALVVLGAVGAVRAGLAGANFMFDLEQTTPALAKVAPTLPDPGTPRLARRVYVVIIDGLRFDKSYELPFLDELRRRGVDTWAQSHYPTWSRPNYVSILTGVPLGTLAGAISATDNASGRSFTGAFVAVTN